MSEMKCPHCGEEAVFQALKPITYHPTIADWKYDRAPIHARSRTDFECVSCEGHVKIDVESNVITAITLDPIFDDFVEHVWTDCKSQPNEPVGADVAKGLKDRNFRKINWLMTGAEVRSAIIEQRP